MEDIFDCDGNLIDPTTIITVLFTITLTSDLGYKRTFIRNWQYVHSGTSGRYVQCAGCGVSFSSNYMTHYHVEWEGEGVYYIPEEVVALENKIKPEWLQTRWAYHEHKGDQPRDVRTPIKELLGVDIEKGMQQSPHDGYEYYLKYLRDKYKNNGKRYGITETEEEDCPSEGDNE